MLASLIITFRETLEAALIVGIILSYLTRTKQTRYRSTVYMGVGAGIAASVLGAVLFIMVAGGFTGNAEKIFEGITTLIGAILLTTMILWMLKQKHIARELEQKVAVELTEAHKFGLFALVFVSVLREGIETVIFLGASNLVTKGGSMIGALSGVVGAVLLSYAMFVGSLRMNIKKFFNITSVVLILFAAGLVAYGVHELQEAALIPTAIEQLWNINPPVNPDNSYPAFHDKGSIGSILKGLFGYNGNPSLIEVLSYVLYLGMVLMIWKKMERTNPSAKLTR